MYREVFLIAAIAALCGCAQSRPISAGGAADEPAAGYAAEGKLAEDDRICERVRRTGTHQSTLICRTRSEIEREAEAGKDTFDKLYDSQRASREY